MKNCISKLVFIIVSILLVISCNEKTPLQGNGGGKSEDRSMQGIQTPKTVSIFFGHQSVGDNILSGVESILEKHPQQRLEVRKIETAAEAEPENSTIYHAYIGDNHNPTSKFEHFEKFIQSGIGGNIDIALMKLCYVDIGADTDAENIFGHYREMIEGLERSYPETTFAHMTVPLTAQAMGIKPLAKRILGRNVRGYEDNIVRERYNGLLREEYGEGRQLFDLAYFESVGIDGNRLEHTKKGIKYYSLAPEYTSDGGHLNERGRKYIAERFLKFLAEAEKYYY
jgi:hypothetical protein